MKNYRVTVNGNAYDVSVEELPDVPTKNATPQPAPLPAAPSAPAVPQAAAPAPAPVPSAGDYAVTAPMPGIVLNVAVSVGSMVAQNQPVVILEAMKMENEIVTPVAGKVTAVHVSKGGSVKAGEPLLSVAQS